MARRKTEAVAPKEPTEVKHARRSSLAKISDRFRSPKASDVFEETEWIPTDVIQMDHALRGNGCPIGRVGVIHGPSHEGKSLFLLVLSGSFLKRGHFAHYEDAERTMTSTWMEQVLGDHYHSEFFRGSRSDTYEEAVERIRAFCKTVTDARTEKVVDPNTRGIIGVDSIRKLVPKNVFEMIAKDSGAFAPRSGQRQAQLNAAWLDELTPLMDNSKMSIFLIAREMEDTNADAWAKMYGTDWKIGGGKGIIFDSSLGMRVTRKAWIKHGEEVVGERHQVSVWKTKVAGKDDKVTKFYFHSSNGKESPPGHDWARDFLEIAERFELVTLNGATVHYENEKYRGREAFLKVMRETPGLRQQMELEIRKNFAFNEPEIDTEAPSS